MRDSFVLIILLVTLTTVRCANLEKDGFNLYKDHLRARYDEPELDPDIGSRKLYYFRTPLQLYMSELPVLPEEKRKRAANVFINRLLSREHSEKRTSKAALSLMLQSKPDSDQVKDDHYCLYGN